MSRSAVALQWPAGLVTVEAAWMLQDSSHVLPRREAGLTVGACLRDRPAARH
jgi:hypothetical protein